MPERVTALKIPSPWGGDERNEPGRAYWLWLKLYHSTRVLRHKLGLHDWQEPTMRDTPARCSWCGTRKAK